MNFFKRIPGAFSYPFKGDGPYILIAGGVFFLVLDFLSDLAFGVFLQVFAVGYYCAYMLNIIRWTACGEDKLPEWPGTAEWLDDILRPLAHVVGTVLVCASPAAAYFFFRLSGQPPFDTVFWLLVGAGVAYFPMALLAVAVFDSLAGLNPLVVLTSMFRVPLQYATACIGFFGVFGLSWWLKIALFEISPVIICLVVGPISLYFAAVEMRILGLLFDSEKERLAWI